MVKWRKKRPSIRWIILALVVLLPLCYLTYTVMQFGFYGPWMDIPCDTLTNFTIERDGETSAIALPYTITDGISGETVVLTTQVVGMAEMQLYFKTVYAPVEVYANDVLIYDYGNDDQYPSYLDDPPLKVQMIDLPDEEAITLRFVFSYPTSRGDLVLDAPLVGNYQGIFSHLVSQQENFVFVYIFFLTMGLLLVCIGLFICTFERRGTSVIWLALVLLCAGLWGLGECDLTGLFLQNASVLYLMAFGGAFYLPATLHFFFRSVADYYNPRPVTCCAMVCLLAATVTLLLQVFGLVTLYTCFPYILVLAVVSFFFGAGYTAYEWRTHNREMAKPILLLWVIVIVAILLEVLRISNSTIQNFGQYVQLWLMVFLLVSGIFSGVFIRRTLALRAQNRRMEQDYKMMEVQVSEQQRYHHLLMETRKTLGEQRHDLRHQLAVIHTLVEAGNLDKVTQLLGHLDGEIPAEHSYCDNIAVSAVVGHYVAKAEENGVNVTVDLVVPEPSETISDSNLCVIFGNILENAMEACERMNGDDKFITLTSYRRNAMLVITMENSFEGCLRQKDTQFYSSKRGAFGIGLSSVQAVAQKHGGNATFEGKDGVFHTGIYVAL